MIIEGIISIVVGVAAYFCLPNWGESVQLQKARHQVAKPAAP
jgi:hypothetical protein